MSKPSHPTTYESIWPWQQSFSNPKKPLLVSGVAEPSLAYLMAVKSVFIA
jgi:hypothetical protein